MEGEETRGWWLLSQRGGRTRYRSVFEVLGILSGGGGLGLGVLGGGGPGPDRNTSSHDLF